MRGQESAECKAREPGSEHSVSLLLLLFFFIANAQKVSCKNVNAFLFFQKYKSNSNHNAVDCVMSNGERVIQGGIRA